MGQFQVLTANPALESFHRETQRRQSSRQAEEQEFDRRFQRESAMKKDSAMRALGDLYAEETPAADPAAIRAPAQASAPGQTGLNTSMAPDRPAPAAIQSVTANSPAAQQPSFNMRAARHLRNTPGAGRDVMQFVTAEQSAIAAKSKDFSDRRKEADKAFLGALLENDHAAAQKIANFYEMKLPPEFINNPNAFAYAAGSAQAFYKNGKGLSGESLAKAMKASAEAAAAGKTPQEQEAAGWAAAATGTNRKSHVGQTEDGNPISFSAEGNYEVHPRIKMAPGGRSGAGGDAGGDTAAIRTDKWRIKVVTDAGVPEEVATKAIVLKQRLTPKDIIVTAQNMMKMTDRVGRPMYKTIEEAQAAAETMLSWASEQAGSQGHGAGQPAPGKTPPPGAQTQQVQPPQSQQVQTRPPKRPSSVPAGSLYSPSRRAWRDKAGKIYNEAGQPVK